MEMEPACALEFEGFNESVRARHEADDDKEIVKWWLLGGNKSFRKWPRMQFWLWPYHYTSLLRKFFLLVLVEVVLHLAFFPSPSDTDWSWSYPAKYLRGWASDTGVFTLSKWCDLFKQSSGRANVSFFFSEKYSAPSSIYWYPFFFLMNKQMRFHFVHTTSCFRKILLFISITHG